MDKNTVIGFVLIAAVLVGFSIFNRPSKEQIARMERYNDSIEWVKQQQAAQEAAAVREAQAEMAAVANDSTSLLFAARHGEEERITLQNELVALTFSTKGGRIVSARLKEYNGQTGDNVVLFDEEDAMMSFAFATKSENILTEELFFTPVEQSDSTLTLRLPTAGTGYIDFCYVLPSNCYLAEFTIRASAIQNLFAPSASTMDVHWHQDVRQQEKGYKFENMYSALTYKIAGHGTKKLSEQGDDKEQPEEQLDWVAFKNQFFSSVLIADQGFDNAALTSHALSRGSGYLKSYDARMTAFFDPSGKEPTKMQLYFGPNHYKTLAKTNKLAGADKDLDLQKLVYLGWPLFRWINRFFTIYIFDWLSAMGLGMGAVLLLMTIIVKAVVFPATYKSYMSSAKMRVLKPHLEEINKKYPKPEDAMKKQQEMMALYSSYGVSPMGGCLPMLLQMPVYIAMFNFVPNAIELRQKSFLWADDLSTYDDIIHWGTDIWLIGDHLSLFCLLFCLTNVLNTVFTMRQQQDMGQDANQMKMMRWMMYLMPVMFLFIFNDYSAGLNYYYFISSLVSIVIMIVLRKTTNEPKLLAMLEARRQTAQAAPRRPSGMMAKLEALQKEQERIARERENARKR